MQIQNKVFLVTGGGNGIGRELVFLLLSKGAKVIAIDKDGEGLKETRRLAGDKADNFFTHHLDITDFEAVSSLPIGLSRGWGYRRVDQWSRHHPGISKDQ